MIKRFLSLLIVLLAGWGVQTADAQKVALKTNLLSDAFLNPNLGLEFGLAPRWTLEISGEFNGWTLSHERRWKHWATQPEVRYWFCDRFGGHFFGIHVHGGQYNVGGVGMKLNLLGTNFELPKHTRFQGWFAGGGIGYGYAWVLGRNFNLEAELGVGYSYTRFDRFLCEGCGKMTEHDKPHNYWGITRLAVSIEYLF